MIKVLLSIATCAILTLCLKTTTFAGGRVFSAEPVIPVHEYDLAVGTHVQRVNGLFAQRVLDQLHAKTTDTAGCLRSTGTAVVDIKTYDSGAVNLLAPASPCMNSIARKQGESLGNQTSDIGISAIRLLGFLMAEEQFNSNPRFARNVKDLSYYDVEFFDGRDGLVHISFLTHPLTHAEVGGCPPSGPIDVTYLFDQSAAKIRMANTAC